MRLFLPEIASTLALLPSFVPLAVGHFLEYGKNGAIKLGWEVDFV